LEIVVHTPGEEGNPWGSMALSEPTNRVKHVQGQLASNLVFIQCLKYDSVNMNLATKYLFSGLSLNPHARLLVDIHAFL
jgi:hypothetical protein